ncbi:MAG: hypothetical protein LUC24_05515, partial [Bacteroidales bacterium]|nr:hypothetical protein [Bacteroidales bacterium]
IVDLTDFYYRYRNIANDEAAVESLKNMYFGETVSMERFGENDGVEVEYWGQIELNGSGREYFARVSPHWMGLDPSYTITVTSGRSYHILYNFADNVNMTVASGGYNVTLEGDVEVEGYHVAVNDLSIEYNETSLARPLQIRVTAGSGDDTVMMNLCQGGEYTFYPVAGVLYYTVSGYITDSFKVVFYGDHFDVEDADL